MEQSASLLINRSVSYMRKNGGGVKYSFRNLLRKRVYLVNLLALNVVWASVSFTHYMIAYYVKYIPGDLYSNIIASAVSECLAYVLSGFLIMNLGTQKAFVMSFVSGIVFALPLLVIDSNSEAQSNPYIITVIIVCVLLTKFGVSCAFNLCYLITG